MSKGIIDFLFREKAYYTILFGFTILFIILSLVFKVDKLFLGFYNVNYNQINSAFISFFGVLFAFLFTIMSVLFSMNKDNLFMELMEKNERTKCDIISYFTWALVSFSVVITISLFFTIVGNYMILLLIYLLYYAVVFSLINLVIFLITFILILRG